MLRYIQEQYFRGAEAHVPELSPAALGLYKGLGFEQVDIGRSYRRSLDGSPFPPPPGQPA